jgi:transposase-like protein
VSNSEPIPITNIRLDGGTQPRAALDFGAIEDYAEAMGAGITFPPVTVFYDGTDYWLADGFHRVKAAYAAGQDTIACEVHQGTLNDAQWFSFSANRANGLRRTNDDKQRAVRAALQHPNGVQLSNSQIAAHVGVTEGTIRNWRQKLTSQITKSPQRKGRDGRSINVAKIGKPRATRNPVPDAADSPSGARPESSAPAGAPRLTRAERIDRLIRLRMSFLESTKRLAHLVGWLGETHGDFEQAELMLSEASNAVSAVIAEIERKALAADPLNASRLEIEENPS